MADRSRTHLLAYAAGAVLLVVLGARLLGPGGETAPSTPRVAVDGAAPVAAPAGAPDAVAGEPAGRRARGLLVHVAGAVRRGGIYRVPPGARVSAALKRARGATSRADMTQVNLAAPLRDGQQVIVPARGAAPAAGAAAAGTGTAGGEGAAGGSAGAPRISLSQATPEQLDQLDGIGPALAGRIVAHRNARGGFRSIEELNQVEGIGPKRFEALRGSVDP